MSKNTTLITYFKLALLVGLLVAVRVFEHYFYDPFQHYFEQDYLHIGLPKINQSKLFFHLFLRYTINSLISIAIIGVAFRNMTYIKFSIYFFSSAFIVLLLLFYTIIAFYSTEYYFIAFYVRRFIIQPIFILLLLPAFYYQEKQYNEF